eukprot:5468908-Prymnesium_polylepis.1
MLPAFWHGMLPEEKKGALSIFGQHEHSFSVECVRELQQKSHVPLSDMQNLRLCLQLAAQDPSHLERGVPTASDRRAPEPVTAAPTRSPTDGLMSFQLHPKQADGTQLYSKKFEHLSKVARRSTQGTLELSQYLDVEISSQQRASILNPTPQDYMMGAIKATCSGEGAKKVLVRHSNPHTHIFSLYVRARLLSLLQPLMDCTRLSQAMAKRKLDALGNVQSHCGFANDPVRLKQLQSQLQLADSIGEIKRQEAAAAASQKSETTAELVLKAPTAIDKLREKEGDVAALTMEEMRAIAFARFNGQVLKGNKQAHLDALRRLITSQPNVLSLAAPTAPLLALTTAPEPAPVPATGMPVPALMQAPVPTRT